MKTISHSSLRFTLKEKNLIKAIAFHLRIILIALLLILAGEWLFQHYGVQRPAPPTDLRIQVEGLKHA